MQRSKLEGKIWMKFVEKSNKREKKMVTFPGQTGKIRIFGGKKKDSTEINTNS